MDDDRGDCVGESKACPCCSRMCLCSGVGGGGEGWGASNEGDVDDDEDDGEKSVEEYEEEVLAREKASVTSC